MVLLHIFAGLLGIASGATALVASKGGKLHARSGLIFVCALLVMTSSGFVLAITRSNELSKLNAIAATLTFYLVVTGYITMRRSVRAFPWIDAIAAAIASIIGLVGLSFGIAAAGAARGAPAPAFFVFSALALLAAIGDWRKLMRGVEGARLVARHLWRMGAALFIATASFFLGQSKVFPEAIRKPALLALPVLLVLFAVLYWLVRVRFSPNHSRVRQLIARASLGRASLR